MPQSNVTTLRERRGQPAPPIVAELHAIFQALPDADLLALLTRRGRGRRGYEPRILWRAYVAYYALGLPSISDLVRLLHNNPAIASVCGIGSPEQIPSQPTFSRFVGRLARGRAMRLAVREVMRRMARTMFERFPDFGKSVAIDSTDIKGWTNGGKRYRGKPSDPDAGWCVKTNTAGKNKYTWGYKVHILADTQYELPVAIDVTAGNFADVRKASPLLAQARYTYSGFHPQYVMADAAYSSIELWRVIRRQYRAEVMIEPNPRHRQMNERVKKTTVWKRLYVRRNAVERLNARLKGFRKLDAVRVRGRHKVMIHALLACVVTQARALAFPDSLRQCVRAA
jgi:transposase